MGVNSASYECKRDTLNKQICFEFTLFLARFVIGSFFMRKVLANKRVYRELKVEQIQVSDQSLSYISNTDQSLSYFHESEYIKKITTLLWFS